MPLIRRLPKRGFNQAYGTVYRPVNVAALERFEAKAEVTPEALNQAGLASEDRLVKILGQGELTKALTVHAHAFSATAVRKIEAAAGRCVWIKK